MNFGPLGFPRLTNTGPLVQDTHDFSEPALDKDELDGALGESAGALGFDREDVLERGEMTDEEEKELMKQVAAKVYLDTGPVNRAKRARLFHCLTNEWARKWAKGLGESTGSVDIDNDFEMVKMKFKGCIGVTESNVPDDIRLIPDEFK